MGEKIQCLITFVEAFKNPETFQKGLALLPDAGSWKERKENISRLRRPERCLESLGAGLLLRSLLLQKGLPLDALSISEKGKPFLNGSDFHFNLSHSSGYVVCAFGSAPCGIDIQQEKEDRSGIARIFFTESENALVQEYGKAMFTRIWALKESYVKYKGEGLSLPLKSFQVQPGTLSGNLESEQIFTCTSSIHSKEETYEACEFAFKDYRIAVCSALPIEPCLHKISAATLLASQQELVSTPVFPQKRGICNE